MKGQSKLSGWGDAESYAGVSNSVAASKGGAAAAPGQTTYLDLAAATEAEALQQRRSEKNQNGMEDEQDTLHLPTSDFGIGRRA